MLIHMYAYLICNRVIEESLVKQGFNGSCVRNFEIFVFLEKWFFQKERKEKENGIVVIVHC